MSHAKAYVDPQRPDAGHCFEQLFVLREQVKLVQNQ